MYNNYFNFFISKLLRIVIEPSIWNLNKKLMETGHDEKHTFKKNSKKLPRNFSMFFVIVVKQLGVNKKMQFS